MREHIYNILKSELKNANRELQFKFITIQID